MMASAQKMSKTLMLIKKALPDVVLNALRLEAEIEMTESKRRCPVSPTAAQFKAMGRSRPKGLKPGTLRASGGVANPVREGTRLSIKLGYGGAAKDYAVVQHERADFHHTTGQAFYLSSVLNESRPSMAGRIAKRVQVTDLGVTVEK